MENRILKLCLDILEKGNEMVDCNTIRCNCCPFNSEDCCLARIEHSVERRAIAETYIKKHTSEEGHSTGKTFREVIADIKEGEVWECGHILITKSNYGIELKGMSSYSNYFTDDNKIFKLQRKEYTFEEAFKAYEEGKEIESCEVLTGCHPSKYKRIANKDAQWREESYSWDKRKYIGIPFYEVRGKWYINN